MTDRWYIRHRDQEIGPLTIGELRAALAVRDDAAALLVRPEGQDLFVPASAVAELFAHTRAAPAPVILQGTVAAVPPPAAPPAPKPQVSSFTGRPPLPTGGAWYLAQRGQAVTGPMTRDALRQALAETIADPDGVRVRRHTWLFWRAPGAVRTPAIDAAPPTQRQNFIAQFWRGEMSLGVTYWLGGLLVAVATSFTRQFADTLEISLDYAPLRLFLIALAAWLVLGAIEVWESVSIWRSANNHAGRRLLAGRRKGIWARLAKTTTVLGALAWLIVTWFIAVPTLADVGSAAFFNDPSIPDYAILSLPDGQVAVAGGFKYGLAADLVRALDKAPTARVVQLDSTGGRVGEAAKVYRVIQARGLTTYVDQACMSACTVAFAAGKERLIAPGALVGFHAGSTLLLGKAVPLGRAEDDPMYQILVDSGFAEGFVKQALSTSPDDMWFPDAAELRAARGITGVVPPGRYAPLTAHDDPVDSELTAPRQAFLRACTTTCGANGNSSAFCTAYCGCQYQATANFSSAELKAPVAASVQKRQDAYQAACRREALVPFKDAAPLEQAAR